MTAQPETALQEDLINIEPDRELAQRIVDHWKNVIAATEERHFPYDHIFVEGAFPDDVYERMLELKIESQHFEALNLKRWARADGGSTRDRMIMCDESFAVLDAERQRFWSSVTLALKSETFRRLVFSKMKGDIALRLGVGESEVLDVPGFVHCSLVRDTEGYRIKPHPDGQPSVVTMMFYLTEDNSRQDLGTSLYVERGFPFRLIGKRFKEVYRFPFVRNAMSAFTVNDLPHKRSMHGRELVHCEGERNSILLSFTSKSITLKNTEHVVQPTNSLLS